MRVHSVCRHASSQKGHTMSQVRLATPLRLVQIAIALVAAIAVIAVMAAPSFAGKKSGECVGIANCITVIDVGGVDVKVEGNKILNDIEVGIVEDSFNDTLNNNTICVQLGLVNTCKTAIEVEILNDLKAVVGLLIYKVDVL